MLQGSVLEAKLGDNHFQTKQAILATNIYPSDFLECRMNAQKMKQVTFRIA